MAEGTHCPLSTSAAKVKVFCSVPDLDADLVRDMLLVTRLGSRFLAPYFWMCRSNSCQALPAWTGLAGPDQDDVFLITLMI